MMKVSRKASRLMGTGLALALCCEAFPAYAQDATTAAASAESNNSSAHDGAQEIIVTGSRIRRPGTDTAMPILSVNSQDITDRGFVSAADALNTVPAINRNLVQATTIGEQSGDAVQAPSLFGLGSGRTLTLINGRRVVTTTTGLGDPGVDANVIPLGLLDRVEVVQGGGAAVYGSGAIAGVVNYVLKDHFQGIEADVQSSITTYGDYPIYNARLTAGTNFAEGRGNIAADVEYTKIDLLPFLSRPRTRAGIYAVGNPADTGPNDGISSRLETRDTRFWDENFNGVIFTDDVPDPSFLLGSGYQFTPDGQNIMGYDPGTIRSFLFATGGQGQGVNELSSALKSGVERVTGNVVGHYDLTSNITVSTELLYARTKVDEGLQYPYNATTGDPSNTSSSIPFTIDNPFLSSAARAALVAQSPDFAAGAPLYVSRNWHDLFPDKNATLTRTMYRGLLAVDGNFLVGNRSFNWSVSGSYGRVNGKSSSWGQIATNFRNALSATRDSSGQAICSINADAIAANDDAACVPVNIFGDGNVSRAAARYLSARSGSSYVNHQVDILATISGDLAKLPAGEAKISATYEHRGEKASFTPFAANQQGILLGATPEIATSGKYHTNELAGELLIPLIGGDFKLPLVHLLEFSGAYRLVKHSIAGTENVWNVGLRWQPVRDITVRASRSRNFRAPTLTQLVAPTSNGFDAVTDPCDPENIDAGPNPSQRRSACLALFEANPAYGTGSTNGAAPGSSAQTRLAAYQNASEHLGIANIRTAGNPDLRNEVALTWTYGIVLQPHFIPGLTITADRIEIDLRDGLSAFTASDFASACFDDPDPAPETCSSFGRLATGTVNQQAGSILTGRNTTFNAGKIAYRGETYNINYRLPLRTIIPNSEATMEFNLAANHTSLLESSVTGTVFTRFDGTGTNDTNGLAQPHWVGSFDVRYITDGLRLTYEAYYVSRSLSAPGATVENSVDPYLSSNLTHSVSAEVALENFALRFGVNNLTNKKPSYPSLNYGADIIGRQFFVGAKARF